MKLWHIGSLALLGLSLVLIGCKDAATADATVAGGNETSELTADTDLATDENVATEDEAAVEESRSSGEMTAQLDAGGQPGQSRQGAAGAAGRAQAEPPATPAPTPVSEDAKKFVGEYVGVVTPEARTQFAERLRNRELPAERIPEIVDQTAKTFESMTITLLASGAIQARIGEDITIENFGTWSAQGDTVRLNLNRRMPMGRMQGGQGGQGGPPRESGGERRGSEGAPRGTNPGGAQRPPAEGQEGRRGPAGDGQQGVSIRAQWDASRKVLTPVDASELIGEFRKVK